MLAPHPHDPHLPDTAFDDLLAAIYQAATEPLAWPRALALVQSVLGAQAVQLRGHSLPTQDLAFCFEPHTDSAPSAQGAGGAPAPLRGGPGIQDASTASAWLLHEDAQLRVDLQVWACPPTGQQRPPEAPLTERLLRHLRHAVGLSLVHAQALAASAVGKDVLQQLHHPLLVLDESRRVLFANRRAQALMQGHPLLFCREGLLRCAQAGDDARLLLAIRVLRLSSRSYLGKAAHHERTFLGLRSEAGARLGVYLHAVRGCAPAGSNMPRDVALALLHDPSMPLQLDADAVAAAWQLTPAEASVALAVRDGMDAGEVAARRRVSVHTVRSQLRQAMGKMGVSKQADLVRQLATLTAVVNRQGLP